MHDNEYLFNESERRYFDAWRNNFMSAVNNGIQFLCNQQNLAGQWQLKQDGLGIVRVPSADDPQVDHRLQDEEIPNRADMRTSSYKRERVNGIERG